MGPRGSGVQCLLTSSEHDLALASYCSKTFFLSTGWMCLDACVFVLKGSRLWEIAPRVSQYIYWGEGGGQNPPGYEPSCFRASQTSHQLPLLPQFNFSSPPHSSPKSSSLLFGQLMSCLVLCEDRFIAHSQWVRLA